MAQRASTSRLTALAVSRRPAGPMFEGKELRRAAPVSENVPAPAQRTVVLFLRWEQHDVATRLIEPGTLPADVDLGLVLPGRPPFFLVPAKAVAYDPGGDLGHAYRVSRTRDGGLPVG